MSEVNAVDNLVQLKERETELRKIWYAQRQKVTTKLYELLNDLNLGPLSLITPKEDQLVEIDNWGPFGEKIKWKVSEEVYFFNPDENGRDFGSSFSLYVWDTKITLNHGSCGEWGLEAKGQWSRLLLMKAIFDHQEDIIRELDPLIDMSVREELWDVSSQINHSAQDLKRIENEKQTKEIISQLKPNLYLCHISKQWEYYKDEQGNFIEVDGKDGYYKKSLVPEYKILKVTDKTIIAVETFADGKEAYAWRKYHLKLSTIVENIKRKHIYVVEDLNIAPPQDEDSK